MPQRLLLDGEDLDELLAEVRAEYGPDARIVRAEKVTHGGVAGLFRKVEYEVTVDLPDRPRPGPRALARAHRARAAAADAAAKTATPPGEAPEPDISVAAIPDDVNTVLGVLRTMTGPEPVIPRPRPRTAPAPTFPPASTSTVRPSPPPPAAPAEPVPPAAAPTAEQDLIDALARLGVPTSYLHPARPGRPLTIHAVMDPPPHAPALPDKKDPVVLVLGAGQDPSIVAQALADRLGTGTPVAVANGTNARDAIDVIQWRAMNSGPLTVTCTIGLDTVDAMRAAPIIAAVKPDQVWVVVDARVKATDTRQWLDTVAGQRRIDALAVRALADTAQPGTVLDLGIPIGYLDGAPANKTAWVSVLAERLDDDDSWN